jgi:SAM-dependent methyltransferase
MVENGYDWKKAIGEAGRVLKPGGRFLFVESAEVDGESFLEEVMRLSDGGDDESDVESEDENDDDTTANVEDTAQSIIFSEVGFDNVDLVLQPHVAGVAIKAMDADLTPQQRMEKKAREEEDRLADLSLSVFERGNKKSRRRKNKVKKGGFGEKEEISK